MEYSKKIFLKYAIQMAAVIDQDSETLLDATKTLISDTSVKINDLDIREQIEYYRAARLFFDYGKKNPRKIRNITFVKKMTSELWFLSLIARKYKNLSIIQLKKISDDKFQQEKEIDNLMTEKQFTMISWYLPKLSANGVLHECGELLSQLDFAIEATFEILYKFFDAVDYPNFAREIYDISELQVNNEFQNIIEEKNESAKVIPEIEEINADNDIAKEKYENEIKYLEGRIHDLEIKVEYAKKDAMRDILLSLNDPAYEYPLGQLYLLSRQNNLDADIAGTLENFFSALKNAGIRTVKAHMIGKEFVITEEEKRKYETIKNQVINLEDKVTVYQPGFRYMGETMIKPIIKKENE